MVTGTTLAIAAIASTALSVGATVYGQAQQNKAQKQQAKYQQAVNEYNARLQENQAAILQRQAERESFAAQVRAQDEDFEAAQVYAQVISQQAASGTVVGLGSNSGTLESVKRRAKLNRLRIRERGEYEVAQITAQAEATKRGAVLTRNEPVSQPGSIIPGAIGTVASGVNSVAANQHVQGLIAA